MTYVIVVNKPGFLPEQDPVEVVTHEDAIEAARAEIDTSQEALGDEAEALAYFASAYDAADALPEDGGVISLPDGYVIDVTRVRQKDRDRAELEDRKARLRES